MNITKKLIIFLSMTLIVIFYQNCSDSFTSNFESANSLNDKKELSNTRNFNDSNQEDFVFSDKVNIIKESENECNITWTLSMPAKSFIQYGEKPDSLIQKNKGEDSFDYESHIQPLVSLNSGKKYYFKVIAQNFKNETIESDIYFCETLATSTTGTLSPREKYWADQGYVLRFNHSVAKSDYGRTGEDFLTDRGGWANGNPTHTNWIDESSIKFTAAPDGSPAMQSILKVGKTQSLNWRGQQLGQDNTDKDAVFSVDVWIDEPRTLQSYIGAGHYWGSAPGVTHTGGGAVNYLDSWSIRAIQALDGIIRGYIYSTLPSSAKSYGEVVHGREVIPTGKWVTLESEVISNDPGVKNGILRTLVNSVISNEKTDVLLRNANNVYPKGMGMLIRNNATAKKTETVYIRNWRIYTKPN